MTDASKPSRPPTSEPYILGGFDGHDLQRLADALYDQAIEQGRLASLALICELVITRIGGAVSMVFAVCFGNYDPFELDSLWASQELARRRAEQLGGGWNVRAIALYHEWTEVEP